MGGKHKQAQRTKNNVRPSSSGRSAELLGNTLPQFVNFSSMKDAGFSLTNFTRNSMDDIDPSVDSNFQLVLKKMNKKDSTTKLKALQEFIELIKAADQEAVKTILPFWTRLYNVLATDAEHKVREATHIAHHQVVVKAKRNLAPFLKQLAGPWFTSQYDTYAPAASAATKSFEDAFPPSKLQEAIVFCQEEILNYICENLTLHTAQSLNNQKTTTEDAEAKYERIMISSLQGYALYLNKVPPESMKKVEELNMKIISNAKFWKLSKNKVAPIRAAWFGVLTALCYKAPFLLTNEIGRISSTVFSNLDENEPTVLPNVWEAALLTVTELDQWWSHINVDKVLLPKLFKVLREGGQGNASVIYPNLLPLLSHLPPNLDFNLFYNNFFDSIRTGLKQKNVVTSRSESTTVSLTLIECLQYIILKNQSDTTLCDELIKNQIMSTIEWCLMYGQGTYKSLFTQIAGLIQYWQRNCDHPDVINYKHYLNCFWTEITALFQNLLTNLKSNFDRDAVGDLVARAVEFLTTLKHVVKPKKQLKVKFSTEMQLNSESLDVKSNVNCNEKFDETYLMALNDLVCNTSVNYVIFIKEKQAKELMEHLLSLLQSFDSVNVFKHLSKTFTGKDESTEVDLINLYDELLLKWLKSSYLSSKYVVDLIFLLFKYLSSNEKEKVLDSFAQLPDQQFGWCLKRSLSHPHNTNPSVQKWLSNKKVDKFLVSIFEKELLDENTPDLSLLLKRVFVESNNDELFISKQAVTQMISLITTCLLNPSEYSIMIDSNASLAAYIASALYTEKLKLTYGSDLLLALFTLGCNSQLNMETITKDTLWEVNTAWQDTVAILSGELEPPDFIDLAKQFADVIKRELLNNSVEILQSEKLIYAIINFIKAVCKNRFLSLTDKLLDIFLIHDFASVWRIILTNVCINAEYINGNLGSYYAIKDDDKEIKEDCIIKFFIWSQITISVLLTPLLEENEDSEDEDSGTFPSRIVVKLTSNINKYVLNILYDLTLAQSFIDNFKMIKHSARIAEVKQMLYENGKILLNNLHAMELSGLELELIDKIAEECWIWAKVGFVFKSDMMQESSSSNWLCCKQFQGDRNLAKLHITQAFARNLHLNEVQKNSTNFLENLIAVRCLPNCDEVNAQLIENLHKIMKDPSVEKYYKLKLGYWEDSEIIIEIIRLCSVIIKNNEADTFPIPLLWDFITVSLASWSNTLIQIKHLYRNIQVASFISAVSQLFSAVEFYIKKLESSMSSPRKFINEWKDVFAEEIHMNFVNLWLYFAEEFLQEETEVHITFLPFLKKLHMAVNCIKCEYIFKKPSNDQLHWSKLLTVSCSLLTNSLSLLQLWGYHMLTVLIPGVIQIDEMAVNTNTPHAKGLIIEHFKSLLTHTQDIVQAMLQDFKLGEDSCRVEPFTDSYAYTFAYLLCWDILLTLCEKSSTELRYQYADWLRNQDFLSNLLNNIFKLMPAEVLHYTDSKVKVYHEYFFTKLDLSLKDPNNSEVIEHMVCWLYAATVSQLPASVRQWWSGTETRKAQIVERVTSAYVSPQLCSQELADVAQHETKFKNMIVKVHPTVREVVAIYTVDEAQMDLVITLPTNYPLGGPDVQCNKQIGGTSHKQWLMQLKMCVLHQNGRIWDGLSLWNNNLDKKFDGVEECYICFAVLHPGTYQLPKLSCQTCRKKFHSACLYKWFSTSNKSTCPICRNLF